MKTRTKVFLSDVLLSLPGLFLLWWTEFDLTQPLGKLGLLLVALGLFVTMRYVLQFSE